MDKKEGTLSVETTFRYQNRILFLLVLLLFILVTGSYLRKKITHFSYVELSNDHEQPNSGRVKRP